MAAVLGILAASPASAQEANEMAELKEMVKAMQQTIADQNARIATLEKQAEAQAAAPAPTPADGPDKLDYPKNRKRVAAAGGESQEELAEPAPPARIAMPAAAPPMRVERAAVRDADTFGDLQQAAPRANNAPLDPELKGFIPIPGTDTMFKIGGSARLDTIFDFGDNGNPNQFVPSTIPVDGQVGEGGGERTTMHGKGTRLSLEIRRPVAYDDTLRVYNEYDFFDDSSSNTMRLRLRHFYGQAWNILIGQTFSAFMDVDAFPDVVDYQGPNGILNRRQPQIRYTHPIYDGDSKFNIFASVEQPESQIDTDATGFEPEASPIEAFADGVIGFRWEGDAGHLQGSTIIRELSYETDEGGSQDVFGWGVSLSGSLNVFEKDKLSAQITYGEGIGRYVNDLGGNDMDAALDSNGDLEAIPVFAAMAGYTHHWNHCWRSTLAGGYVHSDAPDSLGGFAIDNTLYASANLMFHPTTSFRMGLEYLYGEKETTDDSSGDAHRLNFVIRYDLVK